MSTFPEVALQLYIPTWRKVLVGWLGWDDARFDAWVAGWHDDLVDENSLFYHEDEWYYILPLLVPDELSTQLANRKTKQMFNDLAHLHFEELDRAIRGRPELPAVDTPGFDWDAARDRASAVLQTYGYDLSTADETTSYEMRIVCRDRRECP